MYAIYMYERMLILYFFRIQQYQKVEESSPQNIT